MKQHITLDQLNELTEEGKKKLQEWAKDKPISLSEYSDPTFTVIKLPFLSLGQIIEFIQTWGQGKTIIGIYEVPGEEEGNIKWGIKLYLKIKNKEGKDTMGVGKYFGVEKELCDALWETVKEILQ